VLGVTEDKSVQELQDKLLQAEREKEIISKAKEAEVKTGRIQRARLEAQIKELNTKIEKLEYELREKSQENKIASTRIREL
jgi:septal ring factor EnvC (AmiA/AmiB activator)